MKEGSLSRTHLNPQELDVLLTMLREVKGTSTFDFLSEILGSDFLYFMDVFASDSIRVPHRKDTERYIEFAQIYTYYINQKSEDAIRATATRFHRRANSIKRVIAKVESLLQLGGDTRGK